MNKQRARLAEYYGKPAQRYHATFGYITHKSTGRACILLKKIYFVDKNGKKIPMRNDKQDVVISGKHYIADHVWINLTKPWLNTGIELLDGDEVEFDACVEQYKITRSDVLAKREAVYQDARKKCEQIYNNWLRKTKKSHIDNFALKLDRMRERQSRIMQEAKEKQANIELVDYALNRIKKIKVVDYKRVYYGVRREKYNNNRYNDRRYTKFLAWHSMDYASKCDKHRRWV